VANFVLTETPINIAISNKPPVQYMQLLQEQITSGALQFGEITDAGDLASNLAETRCRATSARSRRPPIRISWWIDGGSWHGQHSSATSTGHL